MPKRAKVPRELLDLDLPEVSLVDAPANRRRFLVIKRRDPMSAFSRIKKNEDGGEGAEPTEKAKGKGYGGGSGVGHGGGPPSNDDMRRMPPALRRAMKDAEKAESIEEMKEAFADIEKAFEELEFAAEPEPEHVEQAGGKHGKRYGVHKNAGDDEDGDDVPMHEALADMGRTAIDIHKGRMITEERAKALFVGLEKMAEAAYEMDPITFGVWAENIMKMLPEGTVPRSGVRPMGTGKKDRMGTGKESPLPVRVRKDAEGEGEGDEGGEVLIEVRKMVSGINERLEKIEKARGEPAGGSGNNTTDEPVTKKKESFWSGVDF